MNLSVNKSVIWMRPASVLHPVEIPSAERRVYSTPVAPPTGKFCAAYLLTFGIEKLILDRFYTPRGLE